MVGACIAVSSIKEITIRGQRCVVKLQVGVEKSVGGGVSLFFLYSLPTTT